MTGAASGAPTIMMGAASGAPTIMMGAASGAPTKQNAFHPEDERHAN